MRIFYTLNFVVCFFVFIFASKLHNQALLTTKHIKIMAQFKVHNLIIVDASGSMTSIYEQALAGINETLSTIREEAKKRQNQAVGHRTLLRQRRRTSAICLPQHHCRADIASHPQRLHAPRNDCPIRCHRHIGHRP